MDCNATNVAAGINYLCTSIRPQDLPHWLPKPSMTCDRPASLTGCPSHQ